MAFASNRWNHSERVTTEQAIPKPELKDHEANRGELQQAEHWEAE